MAGAPPLRVGLLFMAGGVFIGESVLVDASVFMATLVFSWGLVFCSFSSLEPQPTIKPDTKNSTSHFAVSCFVKNRLFRNNVIPW